MHVAHDKIIIKCEGHFEILIVAIIQLSRNYQLWTHQSTLSCQIKHLYGAWEDFSRMQSFHKVAVVASYWISFYLANWKHKYRKYWISRELFKYRSKQLISHTILTTLWTLLLCYRWLSRSFWVVYFRGSWRKNGYFNLQNTGSSNSRHPLALCDKLGWKGVTKRGTKLAVLPDDVANNHQHEGGILWIILVTFENPIWYSWQWKGYRWHWSSRELSVCSRITWAFVWWFFQARISGP